MLSRARAEEPEGWRRDRCVLMGAGRTSLRSEAAFGGEPRGRRLHHAIFARFRLARGAAAWFISESVVRSTGLLASVGLFSTNKEDFMAAQDSRE